MRRRVVIVVATIVLLGLSIAGLRALARSKTTQLFGRLVSRVDPPERVVALTFDDGPTDAYVGDILATLASRRVLATFFVIGADMARAPDAARRLVAAGHQLGNHTYSHPHMVLKSPATIRDE